MIYKNKDVFKFILLLIAIILYINPMNVLAKEFDNGINIEFVKHLNKGDIQHIEYSKSGDEIAILSNRGLFVYNVNSAKLIGELYIPRILAVTYEEGEKRWFILSHQGENVKLYEWSLQTEDLSNNTVLLENANVVYAQFLEKSNQFIICTTDNRETTISLWNLENRNLINSFTVPTKGSIEVNQNGSLIAIGEEDSIRLWQTNDGVEITKQKQEIKPFEPESNNDPTLEIIILGKLLSSSVDQIAFSPDGQKVAYIVNQIKTNGLQSTTGSQSNSESFVYIESIYSEELPYQVTKLSGATSYDNHNNFTGKHQIAFLDNNRLLVVDDKIDVAAIWDINSGKIINEIELSFHTKISNVEVSPNSKTIAISEMDKVVLYQKDNFNRLKELDGYQPELLQLEFNEEGSLLFSWADSVYKVWEMENQTEKQSIGSPLLENYSKPLVELYESLNKVIFDSNGSTISTVKSSIGLGGHSELITTYSLGNGSLVQLSTSTNFPGRLDSEIIIIDSEYRGSKEYFLKNLLSDIFIKTALSAEKENYFVAIGETANDRKVLKVWEIAKYQNGYLSNLLYTVSLQENSQVKQLYFDSNSEEIWLIVHDESIDQEPYQLINLNLLDGSKRTNAFENNITISPNGKWLVKSYHGGGADLFALSMNSDSNVNDSSKDNAEDADFIPVNSITLNESKVNMNVGEKETVYATVNPSNTTDKSISWTSSNPQVATVDQNGKIIALKSGTAIITAKSKDGNKTANVQVTVSELIIPVESITVSETELNLKVGQNKKVNATISPSNATNKKVSWISSDSSIATVDDQGNIIAKKQGTTKVTAISADGGKNVIVTVTVTSESIPTDGLKPWEPKFGVEVNKVWNVKFNDELDLSTIIEKNIYVTDRNGNILPMLYIVDRPNSEILVSPVKDYKKREKYTLFIKDLKSKNGKVQNENVYMEFTIKN